MTLAEALQNVELESGQTYQVWTRDKLIQVRVLSAEQIPLAMPIEVDGTITESSAELPRGMPTAIFRATQNDLGYDRPIVITEDDLKAGDLD